MAYSTRTIGIAIASCIACACVVAAVFLSGPLPFHIGKADAESTHDILVSYAAKDTDSDGLPDWEEALYGTDPTNPHSVSPALTDGDAVAQGLVSPKFSTASSTPVNTAAIPGIVAASSTVTDQFARTLFSQYLLTRGASAPTQSDITAFVEQGVKQLEASHAYPTAFNAGQVRVVGEGADAMTAYAAAAEAAYAKYTVATDKGELDYYSDAVTKSDAASLTKVSAIANAYRSTARALILVPAPKEAAAVHLALANAMDQMGAVLTDMATVNNDPLRAMLGIDRYDAAHTALVGALAQMHQVFVQDGVTLEEGSAGYYFYNAANAGAQAAAQNH